MCREYKRGRRTRSRGSRAIGGRNGGARGRRREYRIERESERKTYLFVEGGSVRGCDQCEVSTCVFHSFAILSVHSALERQGFLLTPPSSTRPFLRRRVGYIPLETRENTLSFSSRDGHAAAAYGLGSWDPPSPPPLFRHSSFVRYFSSGTLARQSYSPVALSPTRTAVSFNLAGLYRDSFTAVFLCLRYSVLPPRHARLESVLRREFTRRPGYTPSRGSLYRRPANFARSCDVGDTC